VNYLAHARDVLDRPWVLAGAVLPDWVRIVAPRARIRPWMVDGAAATAGSPRAAIHEGLRRHFEDDTWFHATDAFREVTGSIAVEIRVRHPDRPERRMRASFYAHILLEMLLDAWLLSTRPDAARAFADAVLSLDRAVLVTEATNVAPLPVPGLLDVVERFEDPRVLAGYKDDAEVVRRLGIMGSRVRQPDLPLGFDEVVALARPLVAARGPDLLTPPA